MGNVIQPLWADCPAATRLICVGYPAVSLLAMLGLQFSSTQAIAYYAFTCSWDTVVHHYSVLSLVLSLLFRPFSSGFAFIMTLFEIYMAMAYFPTREKELGSTTFLIWIVLVNFMVNIVFLLLMFALSYIMGGMYTMMNINGLWPMLMICITLRCLGDPNGSTSFWGLVQIPNKWYSICLAGFFCLLSGMRVMWDFVAALIVGYSYSPLRLERFLPSRTWASKAERRCVGSGRCNCFRAAWVAAVDTPGYAAESTDRRYATLSDFGRSGGGSQPLTQAREVQPTGRFEAFGGAGNRLGDGTDTNVPLQPVQQAPPQQELTPSAPQLPAQTQTGESA